MFGRLYLVRKRAVAKKPKRVLTYFASLFFCGALVWEKVGPRRERLFIAHLPETRFGCSKAVVSTRVLFLAAAKSFP
jgi:hypothetical protein